MSRRTLLTLCLGAALALSTPACDDDPPGGSQEEDLLQGDTAAEDGGVDTEGDASTDGEDDSAVDVTSGDTTGGDTTSDTTSDTASDATTDTSPDVEPDIPPPDPTGEDCSNGVDDDDDGDVDCDDADCDATPVCTDEICDNQTDDDRDGLTDCADLECRSQAVCLTENCTNGKDDDGDSDVDCDDADCADAGICTGADEICDNQVDDDDDGLIDCRDPGCWDPTDPDDEACTDQSQAPPCGAEGQQCNPSLGFQQNGFVCIGSGTPGVSEGYPGLGICFGVCDPSDLGDCDFGSACFDPRPGDGISAGFCVPRSCDVPFSGEDCDEGDECTPLTNGYLYCDEIGTLQEGETCTGGFGASPDSKCGEGLVCLAEECRPACDLVNPSCDAGESCVAIYSDVGYGVCDVGCPAFSGAEGCEAEGEICAASFTGAWVCRADEGLGEGEACETFAECRGDLVCAFGTCQTACSYFASGDCAEDEICVGFDSQNQYGVCAESCEFLPDTCSDTAERCIDFGSGNFGCVAHEGGALGDTCSGYFACGQNLYCDQPDQSTPGTCDELCVPFDAPADLCPEDEACLPFNSTLGGCRELTQLGDAQNATCQPRDQVCGDALYCGQGFGGGNVCYAVCRTDLSNNSGRDNPDCGSATETCNPNFGWADLGICVP